MNRTTLMVRNTDNHKFPCRICAKSVYDKNKDLCDLCELLIHINCNKLRRITKPPTTDRQPITDNRPTDRCSTDPQTTDKRPTDKCSTDPPTNNHRPPTDRQVLHRPTGHRLIDPNTNDQQPFESQVLF